MAVQATWVLRTTSQAACCTAHTDLRDGHVVAMLKLTEVESGGHAPHVQQHASHASTVPWPPSSIYRGMESKGEVLGQQATLGRLRPAEMITHHFKLAEAEHAYDVFMRSGETGAMKVVIEAG